MKNLLKLFNVIKVTFFLQNSFSSDAKNNDNIYLKPQIKYYHADVDKINIFGDNRNKIGIYR
jgi:hypothetical protein